MKKNNKTKEISFFLKEPESVGVADIPSPAKNNIPKWYKNISKYVAGNSLHVRDDGTVNVGVKACTSFLDSMLFGYIISFPCDIAIKRNQDGSAYAIWSSGVNPITPRPKDIYDQIPSPPGFGQFSLAVEISHGFVLPKGYSAFIIQPLNHYELNTYLSSGIIDADVPLQAGGIPFAVRDGFEGIIPAGTPVAQILPFKRDNWKSKLIDSPFLQTKFSIPRIFFTGWYKKVIWKKKDFN